MKVLGIIPSRYASSRFPGKPLISIQGKSMIQRVYEQACKSTKLDDVIVATDDHRIIDEVTLFGAKVMMTSSLHLNGTERCAEVSTQVQGYDYIVNIQGDEPFVHPDQLDLLIAQLDGETEIATLAKQIVDEAILDDPGEIKVVFNLQKEAIYFSRASIPFSRDHHKERLANHSYYKHIGLYAYRIDILQRISQLEPTNAEKAESLEQLRWMEHGFKIKIGLTTLDSQMIDTKEDLLKIDHLINS